MYINKPFFLFVKLSLSLGYLKHWSTVIDTEVPCHKLTVSLPSQRESSVLHYKIAMTNCTAPKRNKENNFQPNFGEHSQLTARIILHLFLASKGSKPKEYAFINET